MRADEFAPIAADMQGRWWAFPIPASALDQYVADLADVSAEKVAAAIAALSTDGLEKPPTAGQIRRRVAEMELDAPTWDEVRTALVQWRRTAATRGELGKTEGAWVCPHGRCDGSGFEVDEDHNRASDCACRPALIAARRGYAELPAMVCEFVIDGHVSVVEFDRMLERGDSAAEAQIRERWRDFKGRVVDSRVLAALGGDPGLARIEAARAEHAGREERFSSPRKLDPVALLERGRAA